MSLATQNFLLDLMPGKHPPHIKATQYDAGADGWGFAAHLTYNDEDFAVPEGYTATVEGSLESQGLAFRVNASCDGSVVTFALAEGDLPQRGKWWAKILLKKGDSVLQTSGFVIDADPAGTQVGTVTGGKGFDQQLKNDVYEWMDENSAGLKYWLIHESYDSSNPASPSDMPVNSYTYTAGSRLGDGWFDALNTGKYYFIYCHANMYNPAVRHYEAFERDSGNVYEGYTANSGATVSWAKASGRKALKVLQIGSSFGQDCCTYAPYIMEDMCDNVDVTFGILYCSGGSIEQYNQWIDNDFAVHYYKKVPGATAWTTLADSTVKNALIDEDWDIILFNQSAADGGNWDEYANNVLPYIVKLAAYAGHPVQIGYLMPQKAIGYSYTYSDMLDCAKKVYDLCPVSFVIPAGAAIEIARGTELDNVGTVGHLCNDAEVGHLQEGLPCFIAGLVTAAKLLEVSGLDTRKIYHSSIIPNQAWVNARNIPGKNGDAVGLEGNNKLLGERCAIQAMKTDETVFKKATIQSEAFISQETVVDAALFGNAVGCSWEKNRYIHETTGEVFATSLEVSVSKFIRIPKNSRVIIESYVTPLRYATYDADGALLTVHSNEFGIQVIISSDDAEYFRLQYPSINDDDLSKVAIRVEYDDRIARMSDVTAKTGFSNEVGNASGNPILIADSSRSEFLDFSSPSVGESEKLSIAGKNIFHFLNKQRLGIEQNGVTFHFNTTTQVMEITSDGSTATTISADSSLGSDCSIIDGVAAYHNFHFRFKSDTVVSIAPNYSVNPYYDGKVQMMVLWADDGVLKTLPIGYEGTSIVAKAGKTYGVRVRVSAGFSGSLTLKPQIEVGGDCTAFEQYEGCEALLNTVAGESNLFNLTQENRLEFKPNASLSTRFGYKTRSVTITANSPSEALIVYHPDYDGIVNGESAYYLFKFVPGNVPVCVSGIPKELEGLAIVQIVDGVNVVYISTENPYLFTAESGKEYGYRILVLAGAKFECTINPVIATGREAFKLFGSKHSVTTIYTDGNADLSVAYEKESAQEKANDAASAVKLFNTLTAKKKPFSKFINHAPVITFIDDDTTNPTFVSRFHDILAAENVVGNYAVELRNVENYPDSLPTMLLGYEEEGFGMLYHCYKQDGDADRYWESGNSMYDESLIRDNFYRGLRAYRDLGFHSDKYWVTPYGVNDEFIRALAKEADIECLLTCPTATYASNAIMNLGSNVDRYNIPRFIFLSDTDNDYQARMMIDGCARSNGWLVIVTHVNSWPSEMVDQNTQRLTALIRYIKAAGIEVWNFNRAYQTFKPLLMLNDLL